MVFECLEAYLESLILLTEDDATYDERDHLCVGGVLFGKYCSKFSEVIFLENEQIKLD